jgi:hypothetical protein
VSDRIKVVPATQQDVEPFFKGLPPCRIRALAGRIGDETVGIGGIYYLPDGTKVGFIILTAEGEKHPVTLYKHTKKFLQTLRDEGIHEIRAVADPVIESAERYLLRLDFEPLNTPDGLTVYRWPAQTQSQES